MVSNKKLPLVFVILFCMLSVIWWPSFANLGDLFGYAEKAQFKGVTLLDFFKAEIVVLVTVWAVLISYKNTGNKVEGDQYVIRHLILIMFIIGQVFMGFFAGGFLVHQDASWYQVIHENSEIMPSQAIILLICYPLYLFFGGSAFIYAKTRLPTFLHDKHVAFMVLTFAPLAFLPYYDSGLLDIDKSLADFVYKGVYWLVSMVWVAVGVWFIILKAIQEIFKGLSDPYGEM
ncbi:MAG: methane monooxygenase/ammonia monooxygenase subunit C [Cycloclasticus sp.]